MRNAGNISKLFPLGSLVSQIVSLFSTNATVATGTILDFAGTAAPSGYLLPYGQAVSRTTYAALFAAIGTTYGAGDGSTTFNLPDLRGRVAAGKDNMGGSAAGRLTNFSNNLGTAGGAENHTLTVNEMPNHDHPISYSNNATIVTSGDGFVRGPTGGTSQSFGTDLGGGVAHNNVQPTLVLNKIIKT